MLHHLLCLILLLLIWPYKALQELKQNARVGLSKSEQNTLRFWKLVAFVGAGLVVILALLFFLFEILRYTAS